MHSTQKYRWAAVVAVALVVAVAMAVLATFAPLQGAFTHHGLPPPLTPPAPPTPTPVVLGNPVNLEATSHTGLGEVFLRWDYAINADEHWVWSAKWDNTGGKWTLGFIDEAVVKDLEVDQDYWFIVIAGRHQANGEHKWSNWSNWAKAKPGLGTIPTPTPTPGVPGQVTINFVEGPDGDYDAMASTPCDGPTAPTVPAAHGGGSPTGLSCGNEPEVNFNLTPLESEGHSFEIPMACVDRFLVDCGLAAGNYSRIWDIGFIERVKRRTNGQVQFEVTSFPELGYAGSDAFRLIEEGTLDAAQIHPDHITGDYPVAGIANLPGIYDTQETQLEVIETMQLIMASLTTFKGGVQIAYMMAGDHYLFSRLEVHDDPGDWQDFRVRTPSVAFNDLLSGLGADTRQVSFAELYDALGSGSIDGTVSMAYTGWYQRWHEFADYVVGPFFSINHSWLAVNQQRWNEIPPDLQNIILEEGARHAFLNRHLVLSHSDPWAVGNNVGEGMQSATLSYSLRDAMRQSAVANVVPNWVERAGGPDSAPWHLFNLIVSPIVGIHINPDGSASDEDEN